MKPEDITEAAPRLVNVLAKTLIARKQSAFIEYEGFDCAFDLILNSNIQTVCSCVIGHTEKRELQHSLKAACTDKLKQAVREEIILIELDKII